MKVGSFVNQKLLHRFLETSVTFFAFEQFVSFKLASFFQALYVLFDTCGSKNKPQSLGREIAMWFQLALTSRVLLHKRKIAILLSFCLVLGAPSSAASVQAS